MVIIGHRGARGYKPENTLSSIQKALEFGVDAVEFDVHVTKDGAVVLMHDKTVNRTTNGSGSVSQKTLRELQQLDAGNGETIPTLQEVLDLVNKKTQVNIEIKGKESAQPVADIIKDYVGKKGWKYDDFFVSSSSPQELEIVKQNLPQIKIGPVILGVVVHYDKYVTLACSFITIHRFFVRKSVVEKAHAAGLKVFVYTVNNPNEVKKLKSFGVDGIFSDYPDRTK